MNKGRILILGMGLMGGSLSLAIKKKNQKAIVTGIVRSEKSKQIIFENKIADFVFTESEFSKHPNWESYEFVIFSTPVQSVIDYIKILPKNSGTIFTDLGSTKETIIKAVDSHFLDSHNYVSSHPMCGSEFSGPQSATVDLYEKKMCIVTQAKDSSTYASDYVKNFWEEMGSWTIEMSGTEHDITLAYLSHLPHIVSSILVNTAVHNATVKRQVEESDKPITGGGFRDMSRIAGSNFEMWISIFLENQENIYKALVAYKDELDSIIASFDPTKKLNMENIKSIWENALESKEKIQKIK